MWENVVDWDSFFFVFQKPLQQKYCQRFAPWWWSRQIKTHVPEHYGSSPNRTFLQMWLPKKWAAAEIWMQGNMIKNGAVMVCFFILEVRGVTVLVYWSMLLHSLRCRLYWARWRVCGAERTSSLWWWSMRPWTLSSGKRTIGHVDVLLGGSIYIYKQDMSQILLGWWLQVSIVIGGWLINVQNRTNLAYCVSLPGRCIYLLPVIIFFLCNIKGYLFDHVNYWNVHSWYLIVEKYVFCFNLSKLKL